MDTDPELDAMAKISGAMAGLDEPTTARVLRWAMDRFGKNAGTLPMPTLSARGHQEPSPSPETNATTDDLATLFHRVDPKTDSEKTLAVAYWIQEIEGNPDVDAQDVNNRLKHLGFGVSNITRAFDLLMTQRPQPVIQTRKSGSTKQARKRYRVTNEGIRRVKVISAGFRGASSDS